MDRIETLKKLRIELASIEYKMLNAGYYKKYCDLYDKAEDLKERIHLAQTKIYIKFNKK